jgi:hypothetical protein
MNFKDTNWTSRATVTQTVSGILWFDPQPTTRAHRFYRTVP